MYYHLWSCIILRSFFVTDFCAAGGQVNARLWPVPPYSVARKRKQKKRLRKEGLASGITPPPEGGAVIAKGRPTIRKSKALILFILCYHYYYILWLYGKNLCFLYFSSFSTKTSKHHHELSCKKERNGIMSNSGIKDPKERINSGRCRVVKDEFRKQSAQIVVRKKNTVRWYQTRLDDRIAT